MAPIDGASLTALTVSAKVCVADKKPSLTVKEIFVVPLAFATGVSVTVQLGAVPLTTIPEAATTLVLEEVPVTELAHVKALSTSEIVNATPDFTVSSFVV